MPKGGDGASCLKILAISLVPGCKLCIYLTSIPEEPLMIVDLALSYGSYDLPNEFDQNVLKSE